MVRRWSACRRYLFMWSWRCLSMKEATKQVLARCWRASSRLSHRLRQYSGSSDCVPSNTCKQKHITDKHFSSWSDNYRGMRATPRSNYSSGEVWHTIYSQWYNCNGLLAMMYSWRQFCITYNINTWHSMITSVVSYETDNIHRLTVISVWKSDPNRPRYKEIANEILIWWVKHCEQSWSSQTSNHV